MHLLNHILLIGSSLLSLSLAVPQNSNDCRICIDNVNDCQQMYGGCWNYCETPRQTFEIPACNGVSGKREVCEYFENECGKVFGGCYPEEGPVPGWASPACP